MNDLKSFLEGLYSRYHSRTFLSSDPLEFVHRYDTPLDQEAVGLIASLLAYGNVKQIRRSVSDLLSRMDSTVSGGPSVFVAALGDRRRTSGAQRALSGFTHRLNTGEDLALLLWLLSESRRQYGSLGAHFCSGLKPNSTDFAEALNRLIGDWKAWALHSGWPRGPSFFHLLNAPEDGSVCKRWSLYLRWMGRKDELDPGIWINHGLSPSQLVMPLDTHIGRISQKLGLTQRKTLNWKASLEVTNSLRKFDPLDPVRYDFSLCRVGILNLWESEGMK